MNIVKIKCLLLVLLTVFFSGCATHVVQVHVDSLSSPMAKQKNKYFLLEGNNGCNRSDLQFMEFAAYTDNALQKAGFIKTYTIDDADVAILLSYGISDPHFYHTAYNTPVWGCTGYSAWDHFHPMCRYGRFSCYSMHTHYAPMYGVVGYETHIDTDMVFVRYLTMSGIEVKTYKAVNDLASCKELWSVRADSIGSSEDLRKIFPVLLAASQHHIARSTGSRVYYEFQEGDRRVQEITKVPTGDI